MRVKTSLFSIFWHFKIKISPLKFKKKSKKVQKKRIILFNKVNNFSLNNTKIYIIIEYNGKYFIYNSHLNKK